MSSMVNNPQLSDVQLQVDSGEVYHAHSFMVYARCPLLAEMVRQRFEQHHRWNCNQKHPLSISSICCLISQFLLTPILTKIHESGFSVQEEDMPRAQRVLMSDVPGEAVCALLQYLYTAQCCIPASLQPHVLELASRFVCVKCEGNLTVQVELIFVSRVTVEHLH